MWTRTLVLWGYNPIGGGTQDEQMSKSLSTLRLEGSPTQSRISPSIQRILSLHSRVRLCVSRAPERSPSARGAGATVEREGSILNEI